MAIYWLLHCNGDVRCCGCIRRCCWSAGTSPFAALVLVGFAAAAVVATLTAQKTNNVPPNMNQPQMMQGGVQIINSWCANRSSLGDVAAWMRANDNMNGRNACAIRLLQGGKIEYRYFRRDGRGWNLRSKYLEIVEEINL